MNKEETIRRIEQERKMLDGCINRIILTSSELEIYKQNVNIQYYINSIINLKIRLLGR